MSKLDKQIKRICSRPKDYTWKELKALLDAFGFEEIKGGKTGGSRRRFVHKETKRVITLHQPHPDPLKEYQIKDVLAALDLP